MEAPEAARLTAMRDLSADLDRVETAYRRACSSHSEPAEESLLAELRSEGLGDEWTARDRPSFEVLLASWRSGDSPEKAMEVMLFALRARRHTS